MTEFVSEVKTIPFNEDRIFNMLSDLRKGAGPNTQR